jgi:hypothetical protein
MRLAIPLSVTLLAFLALILNSRGSACAEVLITSAEANLPGDVSSDKGIFRGPTIFVASPAPNGGTVRSPLHLRLTFMAHGGSGVDLNSVVVSYKKKPAVNLTDRVRPFLSPSGIDMPDAEVPPGYHSISVEVRDADGRRGQLTFNFTVAE